jgi:glycosyltransferase involved in cell wall biosynthesis
MEKVFELVIVIPAFNEAPRLQLVAYRRFIKTHPKVIICFVNDGSTDQTKVLIETLKTIAPNQVFSVDQPENKGKAVAVRTGMLTASKNWHFKKIAYLDADLSTSLEACYEMATNMPKHCDFAFGSRISKLDSHIQRKPYRFFIGRCVATFISRQLQLKIYDTQCGCKVMRPQLLIPLFEMPFISKWLFDVEIFHRLIEIYGRTRLKNVAHEIPLQSWQDTDDSKVPLSYVFKLWIDFRTIKLAYKKRLTAPIIAHETVLE